jgi:ribosomal protein S18 acetylase RimI-like enzyme
MNPQVRTAKASDAETIARYNQAMAAETENVQLDGDRLLAGVRAVFEDAGRGFYLLAETGGRVVGQLMITYEWSDWRNGVFWWIQSVYVEPEFRQQGVFRMLYDYTLELARGGDGICGVRLYVEGENLRAQKTYENLGMSRTSYQLYEVDFVLGASEGGAPASNKR